MSMLTPEEIKNCIEGTIDDELLDGTVLLYNSIKQRLSQEPLAYQLDAEMIDAIGEKIKEIMVHCWLMDWARRLRNELIRELKHSTKNKHIKRNKSDN